MADETGGMDGAPFIKTEIPSLLPSRPPGLLPIPGRAPGGLPGLLGQAEDGKQSVQAAMAMAAFYQSPLFVQAAMARERERLQQQHATLPHPAAAVAALSQLPGRGPAGGIQGIPGHPFNLAGMLSAHATTNQLPGLPGLPGAPSILEQSRQDLLRDYLTKLAQSTLNVTTSMGAAPPAPSPQYLQSTSVADIKTEKLVPTSLRRSSSPGSTTNDNITSTVSMLERQGIRQRSPPPPAGLSSSLQQSLNYLQRERDHANAYFPPTSLPNQGGYFGLQRHTSPDRGGNGVMPMSTTGPIKRSPPSTGRRNGSANGREKVFTCNVCNRSFGYKHVLQNHERTHTGEKPFECKECHKRFTRDHHLKTHMRLHTGEKPYSCTHCDRQFVQVANLRRHLRVHTGERPYKCELCPSNFSDSNQMKAHMLTHKGPSFGSLKDELFFRHSWQQAQQGGASFPLPQYPPASIMGSDSSLSELNQSSLTVVKAEADNSSQASMSPDSKETTGSGDSPSHGENLSDSNSEKRRSRKQKPRKMISHYEEGEGNGTSEDTSPRDRNVSSSSYSQSQTGGHSMQQEPEDLSVRPSNQDVRQMELERQMDLFRQSQVISSKETGIQQSGLRNRSEGSDGSLSISDDGPTSIHSTPKDKYRGADDEDMDDKEVDDDERGVSPPSSLGSHGGPYGSALFGGPHRIHSGGVMPIQLGLSGAALPLSREYMEKEKEILAMVAKQQHEISQQ